MCLAVYPNGIGAGAGTHISASLHLTRGEFDDQLKWPMGNVSEHIFLEVKLDSLTLSAQLMAEFLICISSIPADHRQRVSQSECMRVLKTVEKFAKQKYYDSILLRVSLGMHCLCCIMGYSECH